MESKTRRPYAVLRGYQRGGCRLIDIRCPFCNAVVTAHVWSLAGSGKKCECGSLHTYMQGTEKR